jgi:hypothetical protein
VSMYAFSLQDKRLRSGFPPAGCRVFLKGTRSFGLRVTKFLSFYLHHHN